MKKSLLAVTILLSLGLLMGCTDKPSNTSSSQSEATTSQVSESSSVAVSSESSQAVSSSSVSSDQNTEIVFPWIWKNNALLN